MTRDCLVRGVHPGLSVRIAWAETAEMVNAGITTHDADPAAAAALAGALGAAAAATVMLDENEKYSIRCDYPGSLRGLIVEASSDGAIRGFPLAVHPLEGDPDDPDAVFGSGDGQVSVTRSAAGKIISSGQSRAPLADPAGDLAFFFCVSDQIETEIRTFVSWQPLPEAPVRRMAVLMLQALPGCNLEIFSRLRSALHAPRIADCRQTLDPAQLPEVHLKTVLAELARCAGLPEFRPDECVLSRGAAPRWRCRCSRESMSRAMRVLGDSDLEQLFEERANPTIECQFCRKRYGFRKEDFFADVERAQI